MALLHKAGGPMGLSNFLLEPSGKLSRIWMLPSMALSRCTASWDAYARVKHQDALAALAEQDLRDSHAVTLVNVIGHFLGCVCGSAYAWDKGLFNFVSLLYLSRRLRESQDSWNQLQQAGIPSGRLHALSCFGEDLVDKLERLPGHYNLTECLSKLHRDGPQVVDKVLHSDYVFRMPPRHVQGPARSLLLDSIQDKALRDEIAAVYAAEVEQNQWSGEEHSRRATDEFVDCRDLYSERCRPYDLEDWSIYSMVTVDQGLELLRIISSNKLAEALVTQRPPNSALISDFMAIVDCTEHARLLLARSNIPVYYNFPDLEYSKLASQPSACLECCEQAIQSPMGFAARIPSPVDKILRRLATDSVSDWDEEALEGGPRQLATAPPGLEFGKLKSVPVGPNDNDKGESFFRKFVRVLQTIAPCEPLDKLTYLVEDEKRAEAYHSAFLDVAHDTRIIDWCHLLFPGRCNEIVYTASDPLPGRLMEKLGIDY